MLTIITENELSYQANAITYINKVRERKSVDMPPINKPGVPALAANTKEEVFTRTSCTAAAGARAGLFIQLAILVLVLLDHAIGGC